MPTVDRCRLIDPSGYSRPQLGPHAHAHGCTHAFTQAQWQGQLACKGSINLDNSLTPPDGTPSSVTEAGSSNHAARAHKGDQASALTESHARGAVRTALYQGARPVGR